VQKYGFLFGFASCARTAGLDGGSGTCPRLLITVFEKILPNFLCIIPSPYICALFTSGVPDAALFGRVFVGYFVFIYGKI
jgi:hypothetical protein